MKKLLIAAAILAVLAAAAFAVWMFGNRDAPSVRVVTVESSVLNTSVHTNGKVEPEQPFEIRAPMSGPCRRILVREGDSVEQGDLLFTLDDASLRSELAAGQAELRAAEADLRNVRRGPPPEELSQAEAESVRLQLVVENARKQVSENEWLYGRHAISRYELDQSRHALASAEQAQQAAGKRTDGLKARYTAEDEKRAASRVESAAARVRYVELNLARAGIRAPARGTIYSCSIKSGAYVNEGDLMAILADPLRLQVRAFVDEPDLAHVRPGAVVHVRWDARPGESYGGKIRRISSQVVAMGGRSVAEVLCDISDASRSLVPNANVDVEIETGESARTTALPRSIVFPEGKKSYVWLLSGERAQKKYVETGRSTPTQTEIKQGLSTGDRVIVPEDVAMVEGLKVRVEGQ